ncbi:Uncharacterised protein [uncultured archaeon]|nr:Uncharacterised protein [uncultured archaeon]
MGNGKVPDGIAFMSTLTIIIGIAIIGLGVFATYFMNLIRSIADIFWAFPTLSQYVVVLIIAFGIVTIVVGAGLYTGRKWAWYLIFLGTCIFIPIGVGTLNPIATFVDIVILAYSLRLTTQLYYGIEFPVWW